MSDTLRYLSAIEGSKSPYFPPMEQMPDCGYCEKRKECPNINRFQRNRRNFTYTSGRCPRLPDMQGFVEAEERELYAQTFPLIFAKCAGDKVHLSLSLPGKKRLMKVYRNYGYWWFRDGGTRRIINIDYFRDPDKIRDHMKVRGCDYCILPAIITDGYI